MTVKFLDTGWSCLAPPRIYYCQAAIALLPTPSRAVDDAVETYSRARSSLANGSLERAEHARDLAPVEISNLKTAAARKTQGDGA
jgi:hypothetical protein